MSKALLSLTLAAALMFAAGLPVAAQQPDASGDKAFASLDSDKDGKLTQAEFGKLFEMEGKTATDQEKQKNRDHSGISCFIVERSMPGFSSGTLHGKMGIRAGDTGYFSLQDVRVPQANMLGNEGEGFKIAMFSLENGRYTVASGATGVIRAARDASVAYANTREVQGQTIANFQLVKQKIANMEADYQMSHLLWLKAGYLKNMGLPSARAASLAKWQATVRSEAAASMAIEIHGANGYTNDYPVERYLRNCKAAVIYEGTRDIHTLMQADWALGMKKEKAARVILPPYKATDSAAA